MSPSIRLAPGLAALSLLAACSAGDPPAAAPRTVLTQAVTTVDSSHSAYTGEIRARHEVDLAFRVGGKLAARLVDAGAEIRVGQALARLDPADLQLAAESARAQLAAAESDFATARTERERFAGLLAKKFVSQAAFDAKDNVYNSTRARLAQARAQQQLSGNQAAYGTLSSEFPAIVTAVLAEPGQVLAPGQAVLRLARPEEKEVAIAVPEGRLAELRAARDLSVSLWADPGTTLRGELRELSPAADPATRTYAARIRIPDAPASLRLGMTARVSVGKAAPAALRVPLSAVIDQGNGPQVWIVADGKASPRPVQIAQFQEDGALIASGVQPGELVVVTGTGKLVPGQAVSAKPVPPSDRQR